MTNQIILLALFTALTGFYTQNNQTVAEELPTSIVDYDSFVELTKDVEAYRKERLIPVDRFIEFSKEEGTIILDTRSKKMYDQKHIKGAIHLNFSDFSKGKLANVIPSQATRILIYCNNNIANDPMSFAMKSAPLALNIPTFINLYGYGYKNIYELSSLVELENTVLEFGGTKANEPLYSKPAFLLQPVPTIQKEKGNSKGK